MKTAWNDTLRSVYASWVCLQTVDLFRNFDILSSIYLSNKVSSWIGAPRSGSLFGSTSSTPNMVFLVYPHSSSCFVTTNSHPFLTFPRRGKLLITHFSILTRSSVCWSTGNIHYDNDKYFLKGVSKKTCSQKIVNKTSNLWHITNKKRNKLVHFSWYTIQSG